MYKIFISYGHDSNIDLVERIKTDIENIKDEQNYKKFDCWLDSEKLKIKDNWEWELEKAIEESDIVLFFITPHSARRPHGYCLKELSYATNITKTPIIPIMIEKENTPISICQLQYVDLLDLEQYEKKFQELIKAIENPIEIEFSNTLVTKNKNLFNPIDFRYLISMHLKSFEGRSWIYNDINDWLEKEIDSKVLWITADAGYGKSAIASFLADRHPSSVGVHFCQYYSKETKSPINIIKTFAYQLSTQFVPYQKALEVMKQDNDFSFEINNMTNIHDLFVKLLINPLLLLKSNKPLFFIIDALDEATEEMNNSILDMISREFNYLPSWVKVVIVSRPESYIRTKLVHLNPLELKADNLNNINDLKNYIKTSAKSKKIIIDKQQIDQLIKKSEGIILYIKEFLYGLKEIKITSQRIEDFPENLNGIYLQYFQRKFPNQLIYEKEQLDFVSLIIEGYMPFEKDLLMYILNCSERSINKLISSFGSYIKVENNKVSFFHKSIYDWLASSEAYTYMGDKKRANVLILDKLWEYYIYDNDKKNNYHIFLLNSLYKEKKFKELNKILQDILFIGEIYDNRTHKYFKNILEMFIENYNGSISIDNLKMYESFFRENEHLILNNSNNDWKAHQNIFSLAYADGNNSPLSKQASK